MVHKGRYLSDFRGKLDLTEYIEYAESREVAFADGTQRSACYDTEEFIINQNMKQGGAEQGIIDILNF